MTLQVFVCFFLKSIVVGVFLCFIVFYDTRWNLTGQWLPWSSHRADRHTRCLATNSSQRMRIPCRGYRRLHTGFYWCKVDCTTFVRGVLMDPWLVSDWNCKIVDFPVLKKKKSITLWHQNCLFYYKKIVLFILYLYPNKME